jgi:hypothetical protein
MGDNSGAWSGGPHAVFGTAGASRAVSGTSQHCRGPTFHLCVLLQVDDIDADSWGALRDMLVGRKVVPVWSSEGTVTHVAVEAALVPLVISDVRTAGTVAWGTDGLMDSSLAQVEVLIRLGVHKVRCPWQYQLVPLPVRSVHTAPVCLPCRSLASTSCCPS